MLEQLVNSFLKAPRGKIMNCPKKSFLSDKYHPISQKKLVKYQYDGSNAPEGVLEQLVNCFLEAIGGCPAFRHIHDISYKTSLCKDLKNNLKERLCMVLSKI